MDYVVVTALTTTDLAASVKKRLDMGWRPCGGVATGIAFKEPSGPMMPTRQETVFLQAMTKDALG
jgi:hypothetical protein